MIFHIAQGGQRLKLNPIFQECFSYSIVRISANREEQGTNKSTTNTLKIPKVSFIIGTNQIMGVNKKVDTVYYGLKLP